MKPYRLFMKNAWWRECRWRIVYAIDYRGRDDDRLTFVFRGACMALLQKVFKSINLNLYENYEITEEHDCVMRNGKGYWRLAVMVSNPARIASVDVLKTLIERRICQLINADVVYYDNYEKFLNV